LQGPKVEFLLLSVTNNPFMLNVVTLSVVMLSVVKLNIVEPFSPLFGAKSFYQLAFSSTQKRLFEGKEARLRERIIRNTSFSS
jgi:hypothetical protein